MMATHARRTSLPVAGLLVAGLILIGTIASPLFAVPQRQMKIYFINTGVQTSAVGKLMFVANPAQSFFTIKVGGLTPGDYDLMLNGAVIDTITVNQDGEGKVTYRSRVHPRHGTSTPLPYDPRGGVLEIQSVGVAVLSASIPFTAAEAQQKLTIHTDLTNMGIQPGATAGATLTSRFGRIQFEVEVDDALPGTYDLAVDGVTMAQITVDATGSGQVRFDSRPSTDEDGDDGLDQLLTFDPRGKTLTIVQGTDTDFSELFPLQ